MPHNVAVIGAGVIGLTSAIELLKAGHRVTIFTRERPEDTTSWIPAALWFPYHAKPEVDVNRWALATFDRLMPLMDNPSTGVRWVKFSRVWTDEKPPEGDWMERCEWEWLQRRELPQGCGFGYRIRVPLMENPTYMRYLRDSFKGSWTFGDLNEIADVPVDYDVVVNCSGYGARRLVADEQVRPGRGVAVLTEPIGLQRCVVNDQWSDALTYVISRKHDCVFGGCNEDDERLTFTLKEVQVILARCAGVYPPSSDVRIRAVRVGLRPMRESVRLKSDVINGRNVIHNYGHGGSGFTLSWGCAEEVASMVGAI